MEVLISLESPNINKANYIQLYMRKDYNYEKITKKQHISLTINFYLAETSSSLSIFLLIATLKFKSKIDILYIFHIYSQRMYKVATIFVLLIICSFAAQKNYTSFVNDLKNKMTQPEYKHSAWNRLAYLTDTYGPRMWGSAVLEQAIHEMMNQASKEGFDKVRLQPVKNFTKWVRGKQSLTLLSPRPTPSKLDVIGLGGSVKGDVQAQVIVVETFDELQARKVQAKGRIVCFNNKWVDYMTSVPYRVDGPSIAAKYGALATLVRSVASESISSVHTGYMEYDLAVSPTKIPCAAITVEDAQMFARMQKRGQIIKVRLILQNQFIPNSYSNNLIFEITGSQFPDQIILAGGHIDTWDTGSQTGANDDGGGFISVFQAFRLLLKNGYRPRRTLRFIAWSGEESGSPIDGAAQYISTHLTQLSKHVAAFESDLGSTKFLGIGHQGAGQEIVKGVLNDYMSLLGATRYEDFTFTADIQDLFESHNIPIFDNVIEDAASHDYYFKYHHSAGDSMSMMNPDDLDSNVLGIATFLYIIADLQTTVRDVTGPTNLKVYQH